MTMTNEEIVRDYNQAANKSKQIKVLAELNCVSPGEIRAVLAQAGVAGVEAPKRGTRRKTEAPGAGMARPQGSEGTAQGPAASEPRIYDRIETILAALPEGASDYIKAMARNLVAAMFRENLEQRLGKAGQDETNTDQ